MTLADTVLPALKRFQRATVEYVFRRLYLDDDATDRFLIADEVGLGKTMVARGVIAKAIDHLEGQRKRIDVVYVCSNQVIAHQNITKLMVAGEKHEPVLDRVTMLPAHVHDLEDHHINLIPLTPQTSLDLRSNVGARRERALLWHLLAHELGQKQMLRTGPRRFLQGPCHTLRSFDRGVEELTGQRIDEALRRRFLDDVKRRLTEDGEEMLLERFERLSHRLKYEQALENWDLVSERNSTIGELRRTLARSCIDALEPDLVILDEFQRFRNLLDPDNPAGELADLLFAHPDAKVMLLSATPYKMLTRDVEAEEDHYQDFIATLKFLFSGDTGSVESVEEWLQGLRRGLQTLGDGGQELAEEAKARLEQRLKRVMVRTERLAVSGDRNGMVRPVEMGGLELTEADVSAFADLDRVARALGASDTVEYWKSSPYPLNFMDAYVLSKRFEEQAAKSEAARPRYGLLDADAVRAYESVDAGNARMRALIHDTVGRGLWKLLWLPPSMPYHRLGKPFAEFENEPPTKRLIFSAWAVVPKAIACLTSYEAERRLVLEGEGARPEEYTAAARAKLSPPLRFASSGERNDEAANMTTFALIYPCRVLAEVIDPLEIAGGSDGDRLLSMSEMVRAVERELRPLVKRLTRGAARTGREDVAWYGAIPLLLDVERSRSETLGWLRDPDTRFLIGAREVSGDGQAAESNRQESRNWTLHLEKAMDIAQGVGLGRPPEDLLRIVSLLALGSPAVTVRRALKRVVPTASDRQLRHSAVAVADQLRGVLNQPEIGPLIRMTDPGTRYWEDALRYCAHGCLQSVFDEYAHVLREWAPIYGETADDIAWSVATAMAEALSLRAPDYEVRDIAQSGVPKEEPLRMRSRFAHRFADTRSSEESQVSRAVDVRAAFNSPFWPFVLATTSVGQEGLDFHLYCHAVVHWNLPANPVDFEQREGRVHRYKCHAVRLNLAHLYRPAGLTSNRADPWASMFATAEHRDGDLQPYWVLNEGPARIERYVPALPWSRDEQRRALLERLLACYRLAFGQPRQDDLLAYLGDMGLDESLIDDLTIHLTPPPLDVNDVFAIQRLSDERLGESSDLDDPEPVYLPEGFEEISPEYAEMPLDAVEDAYSSGSDLLRILLEDLAAHPDEPRPYSEVERRLEWSRGTIATVFGGYSNKSKRKYERRRPFHLAGNEYEEYWIWADATRAEQIRRSKNGR